MRFIFEIIVSIGAAYGIGWLYSNYRKPVAPHGGDLDYLNDDKDKSGALALILLGGKKRAQSSESAARISRPLRDKSWLS